MKTLLSLFRLSKIHPDISKISFSKIKFLFCFMYVKFLCRVTGIIINN